MHLVILFFLKVPVLSFLSVSIDPLDWKYSDKIKISFRYLNYIVLTFEKILTLDPSHFSFTNSPCLHVFYVEIFKMCTNKNLLQDLTI